MQVDDPITELIERYLNNQLSDTERASFEKKVATDPELKQHLDFHYKFVASMEKIGNEAFKATLDEIHEEVVHRKGRVITWRHYVVAASILFVMAFGFIIYRSINTSGMSPYFVTKEVQYKIKVRGSVAHDIVVNVIPQTSYDFHYLWANDTLRLYGDFRSNRFEVFLDPYKKEYFLEYSGKYPLPVYDEIRELQSE
ncbi:hypothetical protein FNH22_30710 [Fulvivirga sp. M361]|uniref:hypothetical protein n=1 Tax=Fulvivirga sp. M361 TaxID=2594266 RepID=UPI00117B1D5C|nr:hypothetical protein [Fulvivirga sp. M361]TRX46482.1 hypothetical protein FNH22_30710 [Fulvivirga sp. M361]